MKKYVTFFETIAILLGTVVGAGIFGLPYAFAKIGYVGGIVYLIFLGVIVLVTNLCFGEMVLRTNEALGVSGYVKKYLGQRAWWIMSISLLLGLYSALTAYIVAFSKFGSIILAPIFGDHHLVYAIIFWAIGSFLIMRGSKVVAKAELGMTMLLILMTLLVFIFSLNYINPENYKGFNLDNLFFPYGVVLFALGGLTAVPTMRKILGNDANLMRSALIV
ncbi:MAG: aromatic amino acid transport family protein [Patescibacteria group bacterium]